MARRTPPLVRRRHRRSARGLALVATVSVAAVGLLGACTRDSTATGDNVSRTQRSTDTAAGQGRQDVPSGIIASVDAPPCPEFSDEHICMFVKNQAVGFDANGNPASLPFTMRSVQVHEGRYHWGPHEGSWQTTKDRKWPLNTGDTWRMEINDDGNNYAHADFWLEQAQLGTVQGWAMNNGGRSDSDSYGGCRGNDHLSCWGWLANGSEDPDEEAASYAYLIRNAPLTVKVENAVPGSKLTAMDAPVLGGPLVFADATTLTKDATAESNGALRWTGFRSFANNDVNTFNAQFRLTSIAGTDTWNNTVVNVKVTTDSKGMVKDTSTCSVLGSQSIGTQAKCFGPDATASANAFTPITVTVRVAL